MRGTPTHDHDHELPFLISDELRSNEQTNINNDLDEDEKGMDIPITNAFYETELFWLGFRDHIGDYILYISLVALIAIVNRVQTIPQKSIEKVKLINIVEIYSDKFIEKIEKLDLNKLSNCILDMKFTSHKNNFILTYKRHQVQHRKIKTTQTSKKED